MTQGMCSLPPETRIALRVPPADRRVEELRTRLMLARVRTRARLGALRTEVAEQTDWHTWYRAHPVPFLAAAFMVGFWLGKRR